MSPKRAGSRTMDTNLPATSYLEARIISQVILIDLSGMHGTRLSASGGVIGRGRLRSGERVGGFFRLGQTYAYQQTVNIFEQRGAVNWFGHITVETGFKNSSPVAVQGICGQRDHRNLIEAWVAAQMMQHCKSIDPRQLNIEQHQVGLGFCGHAERLD